MLGTRGWSNYRWMQEVKKREATRRAKKGWATRRLMAALEADLARGYKTCASCPRTIRADATDGLCGHCWSAKHAVQRVRHRA